jgi:predicted GIY-YIG superfamily endonuclease
LQSVTAESNFSIPEPTPKVFGAVPPIEPPNRRSRTVCYGRRKFQHAWVYILQGEGRYYIGATDNLDRRIAEHMRGSNHTTRRFGQKVELTAAKQLPSMTEARVLERQLKRKKNPRLAILALKSRSNARD